MLKKMMIMTLMVTCSDALASASVTFFRSSVAFFTTFSTVGMFFLSWLAVLKIHGDGFKPVQFSMASASDFTYCSANVFIYCQ